MTAAILQPGYLPWLGAFEQMARSDLFVFWDDVQFTTKDWRNRNRLKGPNGPFWLTVPVVTKGLRGQRICDVRIDNSTDWRRKHWKSIGQAYLKAPHFGDYAGELEGFYQKEWELLSDLDVALTLWMARQMGLERQTLRSSSQNLTETDRNGRIIECCKALGADHLYDGASARGFIDTERFRASGIDVEFQDYHHPEYQQLWPKQGFVSHLSALDLLLNCGPDSLGVLSCEGSR